MARRARARDTRCRRQFRILTPAVLIAEHRALLRIDSPDRGRPLRSTGGGLCKRVLKRFIIRRPHEGQSRRVSHSLCVFLLDRQRAGTCRRCRSWCVVWSGGAWSNRSSRWRSRRIYGWPFDCSVLGDAAICRWRSLPDRETSSLYAEAGAPGQESGGDAHRSSWRKQHDCNITESDRSVS